MKKDGTIRTYGRHRNRVIIADAWLSGSDKNAGAGVFSTSSDDSSRQCSIFQSSSSSDSLNCSAFTRSTRQSENKENVNRRKCRGKKEVDIIKDKSSFETDSSLDTKQAVKTRALRDRNKKIDYNDSAHNKRQVNGTTAKRKRPLKVAYDTGGKEASINFSDFDNYSLVVSDSPDNHGKANSCVETSTPVAKRTRCKVNPGSNIKVGDISHIEVIPSPCSDVGYTSVETPDSVHSQSLFNSPSMLSSVYSGDASSKWFKKQGDSLTMPSVELKRLKNSFIVEAMSGSKSQLVSSVKSVPFNNSDSLFSTPVGNTGKLSALTESLKKLKCGQLYRDSFAEDDSDLVDHPEEELEEESDSDGEETEEDEDESEVGELSAIHESEEASESEENEDDTDSVEVSADIENDLNGDESSQEDISGCNVMLDRLSQSLLLNHVNKRGRRRLNRREQDLEIENLSAALEKIQTDSNGTLYMLNEDDSKTMSSMESSVELEEDADECSEDENESKCDYHTAHSSTNSEYKTPNGDFEKSDDEDKSLEEEKVQCTPKKKYSLRGKFHDLQNSFSEILTPSRQKDKPVPLSAQARVFVMCDQTEPITFKTAFPNKMLRQCKKIGDGVYGEVFRSYNNAGEAVAIKIIPIEGDFEVNDEPQKKFAEILPEIVIAKELSQLRDNKSCTTSNFCEVNSVSCVRGKYPAELVKQWDIFYKNRGSENDRPDVFPEKQLYIVFEFADCGTDLESYQFDSIQQAKSVLTQVAYSLAVAEESLQFEHRDLHWGNVLVRPTEVEDICFKLMGKRVSVPSFGVEANIIDFTLSRLTKDGCTVFTNLANDDSLFNGKGDYQFDVYREMKKELNNKWDGFCPHNNVSWLHYLADKLVYSKRYPSQSSRKDRDMIRHFRQFLSEMLKYGSSMELSLDASFLNS